MKAFERKDIYDFHNSDSSVKFMGEDGYFGNNIDQIKRAVKFGHIGILAGLYKRKSLSNVYITKGGRNYGLFLPRCNVYTVEDSRIKRACEEFV